MADHVEQIKSRLDIVDVISGYLKLQKAGVNYKARCPFHNEKTPSFHVSTERQIWHCFGCAKGGDMFSFVEEIEGVEFPEALKVLASKAGVTLEEFRPGLTSGQSDRKARLYDICELASKFFEKQLWQSVIGQKAVTYLRERKLTDETMKQFRLGFAPDDWQALGPFLMGRGYKEDEVIAAGLAVKRDPASSSYDRFRSRITFPIADVNGRIVGFSGRVFGTVAHDESELGAKYINTPQTAIYDKGKTLYGLDKAKLNIKQANRCVLVEGNMDAIMSHQGGVQHAVATSGTALTPAQLRLLGRYTTTLDFCFDTDQAGQGATRRGIGLALSQNFQVNVVPMTDKECKDPADFVQRYGNKWQEVAAGATPVIDFYFNRARQNMNLGSVSDKKSLIAVLAPLINRLNSQVERSHWVSQLATFLRVREEAIRADLATAKDDLQVYTEGQDVEEIPSAKTVTMADKAPTTDMLHDMLLTFLLKNPQALQTETARVDSALLDPLLTKVITRLAASGDTIPTLDMLTQECDPQEKMRLEFAHLRAQEEFKDMTDADLIQEFQKTMNRINRRSLLAQLTELEFDIKQAEATHDKERMIALVSQFVRLTEMLAAIHNA